MNKNLSMIIIIVLVLISSAFILFNTFDNEEQCFRPSFTVIGDINNPLKMNSYKALEEINIKYKNRNFNVIKLTDILKKAKPFNNDYKIIFSAADGLQAEIPGENLEECYIHFSIENGWEAINLNHPVSSNVKFIENIIVVSSDIDTTDHFSIITKNENLLHKTAGQFLAGEYVHYPNFEGSSSLEKEEKVFKDSIYTIKKVLKAENLVEGDIKINSYVIGEKGNTEFYRGGLFEITDNSISYFDPERKITVKNCKGLVVNPPARRNSDVYHDALYYLEKGENVLIILLDGFAYHQYQYAVEKGYIPFLTDYKEAEKAISVYKPVTNAGLAATLTGAGPGENGVYSREQMDLKTDDVFAKVSDQGGKSLYIEGNIKILNTSIEPLLNPDLNNNNSTDDEVFTSAYNNIDKDYNLIYVHFHGIDDYGHDYGDLSKETMGKIQETDSYLERLITKWSGQVIITADHGMHSSYNGGGDHGSVRYEDLIVPYILAEGGKTDE